MADHPNRREFLARATCAAAGLALQLGGRAHAQAQFKHSLKKAVIIGKPTREALEKVKAAGFDGIEAGIMGADEAAKAGEIAKEIGVRIHSVTRGWATFNGKPEEVAETLKVTEDAIRAAEAYGADAVLLVPCRIDGVKMPQPWEFKIEIDEATGHLLQVVDGDNSPYRDYIRAHDHAYATSYRATSRLIPLAARCKVVIAIENVWNNLWVTPEYLLHFVKSFDSPWVQTYFDIGNHVKYSMPETWIPVLGETIVKCHVKDFKLNEDGHGGKFVDIRDGSVNWPVVRKALDDIGYDGWMTIEGSGGLPLEEQSKRLDQILAGE